MRSLFFSLVFLFITNISIAQPYIIGVAGGTGAGKTTVARMINQEFGDDVLIISQDSYYRSQDDKTLEERAKTNFDHPDALDFKLLAQHIRALKNHESVSIPVYDFATHSRLLETEPVEPKKVIVIEGILIYSVPEIRDLCDLKIFVDTSDDIRVIRRFKRDIEERQRTLASASDRYLSQVKPMHDFFVEPSKKYADLIIPWSGCYNECAVDLVNHKIRFLLTQEHD